LPTTGLAGGAAAPADVGNGELPGDAGGKVRRALWRAISDLEKRVEELEKRARPIQVSATDPADAERAARVEKYVNRLYGGEVSRAMELAIAEAATRIIRGDDQRLTHYDQPPRGFYSPGLGQLLEDARPKKPRRKPPRKGRRRGA
jgi:hypothetical protein